MPSHPLSDATLSRRLERAEARANAAFVEARSRRDPASGAEWRDVSGTWAMFDGAGSPITQAFGLGLFAPASADDLAAIERFFAERGADTFHEVSPLADPALLALLGERGYRAVELTTVLHQPLDAAAPPPAPPAAGLHVRTIAAGEEEAWSDASARGWGETPEVAEMVRDFGRVTATAHGVHCFVAEHDGAIVGTGAVAIHDGVALLAGASTLREWRRRGVQAALLAARLRHAAERGCDLAMMGAQPGSTSQLNAERRGFRIAYTRTKWWRVGTGPLP